MVLLRDLMLEIKVFIDFYKIKRSQEKRAATPRKSLFNTERKLESQGSDDLVYKHILKRFTVLGPSSLKATIKKCEAQGLLLN